MTVVYMGTSFLSCIETRGETVEVLRGSPTHPTLPIFAPVVVDLHTNNSPTHPYTQAVRRTPAHMTDPVRNDDSQFVAQQTAKSSRDARSRPAHDSGQRP